MAKRAGRVRPGGRAWRTSNTGRSGDERAYEEGDHRVILREWETSRAPSDDSEVQAIVMVHGIGMGQQYFGLLRDELRKRMHVIAVDLPGFGNSPEPSESLPIGEMAELLGRALDMLVGRRIVALGHSMGTQIVAELAARRPDVVDRVVLIAPTVNSAKRSFVSQAGRLLTDLATDPPTVALVGMQMYVKAGPRWFAKKFNTMMQHRIEDVAPRISQPTLVIRGEKDLVCPEHWVRNVTELIPNATMKMAEGKGHEAMITGAEPVSDMVSDFAYPSGA